jgi:thiamine kinase-like enzyme
LGPARTRADAITKLGQTLRRVHELPLPPNAVATDARSFLRETWSRLADSVAVPNFVTDSVTRMLGETPPASGRDVVLSHNDVNPTNLIYDGEHLLMLDWDTAGPNDPFYDLAAVALFLAWTNTRAHDGEPTTPGHQTTERS